MESLQQLISTWLDPERSGPLLLDWSLRLVAAILIFVIGRWIAKALAAWFRRTANKAEADPTLIRFLTSLVYIILMVLVVLTALSSLGINTTNFLAVFGAAGLAIGLALKDSLSNFAAGVMLVFFRPFKAGDFIALAIEQENTGLADVDADDVKARCSSEHRISYLRIGNQHIAGLAGQCHDKRLVAADTYMPVLHH